MKLAAEWAEKEWYPLVADSGLKIGRVHLLIYCREKTEREPICLHGDPNGSPLYPTPHLVRTYQELPGCDEVLLSASLRHELEVGVQWERWGSEFIHGVDGALTGIVTGYDAVNFDSPVLHARADAARSWVRRRYGQAEVARLQAEHFSYWERVPEGAKAGDLRTLTVAALRALAPPGHTVMMLDDPPWPLERYLAEEKKRSRKLPRAGRRDRDVPAVEFFTPDPDSRRDYGY